MHMKTQPPVQKNDSESFNGYVPKTKLGRKLFKRRKEIVESGMRLFTKEEILERIRKQRAGE
jgi:hypothetical protein